MKKCIFLILLVLSACGGTGGETLVSINGKDITNGDLEFIGTINPRIKMQMGTPFGKKQILDNLVEQELLYQAATRKGLQRSSDVKAKIDLYKKVIISQAFMDSEIEKKAKEYYDNNKGEFERLELSHIEIKFAGAEEKPAKGKAAPKEKVTRTKAQALDLANKIKERLDKGEDFAAVAKEVSEDTVTKNNGGFLGKASKDEQRLERRGWGPLLEKAFTMQVGEKSGPIETKDGYHLITVTHGVEQELFDDVKQAILFKVQGDERAKILADLKKNSKVVYAEEKKPATPAEEAPQPAEAKPADVKPAEPAPSAVSPTPPAAK